MNVILKKADYDAIVAHARVCLPEEACGLIAGHVEGETKTIDKVFFLTNIDRSAEHFSIDPREQLAAVRKARTNGWAMLGNWHSHPETPSRPSAEDIRLAVDSAASYLILSLAEAVPVLNAFSVKSGIAEKETLIIKE